MVGHLKLAFCASTHNDHVLGVAAFLAKASIKREREILVEQDLHPRR
jgi:hypothetical protein